MADRLRRFVQQVKDKVQMAQVNVNSREKVDQLVSKYVPAERVSAIANRFKQEAVVNKVKEMVNRYEKFTGIEEIMAIQNTVVEAQVCYMTIDIYLISKRNCLSFLQILFIDYTLIFYFLL